MMDTSELVHKARRGDDYAFGELVTKCQEKLFRIAYSYVKNRDDALDIVSESVYTAYTKLSTLKNPEYFNTWIIRITINQSLNLIKKNKKVALKEEFNRESEAQKANLTEEAMDLQAAMDLLNENQKTVIILKYFEDLSITQVAEVMKRPVGTVKSYLHGALKSLRLELKEVLQ